MKITPVYKTAKFWKWCGIISLALLTLVACSAEESAGTPTPVEFESNVEVVQSLPINVEVPAETAPIEQAEIGTEVEVEASPKPLSKADVLAKYALWEGDPIYENATFLKHSDIPIVADMYFLAETESFNDATVVFQDGQLAWVKLALENSDNVGEAFAEFGITDAGEKARRASEYTHVYEYALVPAFWTQNIKKYPYELD